MNIVISKEILENEKLLHHLKENSYFIKYLNRDPEYFKEFKRRMKIIYKERPSDKINSAIDGVEMISAVIDSMK